jgi:hypothetical protein
MRTLAQELVRLQPDVILTAGSATTASLQRETRATFTPRTSAVALIAKKY